MKQVSPSAGVRGPTEQGFRTAPDVGRRGLIGGLLVAVGAMNLYVVLSSSFYNPDGLRVFPGLHRVEVDAQGRLSYHPNPWRIGYEPPNYLRANVQKHFLFPIYTFAAWRMARLLGYSGSGLRPLQVANAVSAGIALALCAVLLASFFANAWATPVAVLGLAFSSAFGAMATNIAEVVPAIPWLLLTLVLVARAGRVNDPCPGEPRLADRSRLALALLAGVAFGISTGLYAVSALVGLAAVVLVLRRRPLLAAVSIASMIVSTGAICGIVLFFAGYHGPAALWHALTFMPEQGTYGGFRPTNLVAVLFGFAGSVFPVLPDDFAGLRQLASALRAAGWQRPLLIASVPAVVAVSALFAAALFRVRSRLGASAREGVGLGLAVFLGALIASLLWDPYHAKFWMYSNVGLWLVFAGLLDHTLPSTGKRRSLAAALSVIALLAVVACGTTTLGRRHGTNPRWLAAQEMARVTDARAPTGRHGRLLIGGWEPEFDYLTLLIPESSLLTLPDRFLEHRRDTAQFAKLVDEQVKMTLAAGGRVFFVNLFNRDSTELRRTYVDRLGFPGFPAWLARFRPNVKAAWHDERTGIELFEFVDSAPASIDSATERAIVGRDEGYRPAAVPGYARRRLSL